MKRDWGMEAAAYAILSLVYVVVGLIPTIFISHLEGVYSEDEINLETAGIWALWPIFVVKWVGIGLWALFSTGFGVLVS